MGTAVTSSHQNRSKDSCSERLAGSAPSMSFNAGQPGGGDAPQISDELWCDVINTNLTGVFRVTKEVLTSGGMLERKRGQIIKIASTGGGSASFTPPHTPHPSTAWSDSPRP